MSDNASRRERDLDDLLGSVEPPKRKPGRPRKDESDLARPRRTRAPDPIIGSVTARERRAMRTAENERPVLDEDRFSTNSRDVHLIANGVSVQWLAKAFGITRDLVGKKLQRCRHIDTGAAGNPLYDLREAASYIVEPKLDIEEYLATIKPDKLPDRLRESFWNARLKEQKFNREAGSLWYTEQVMAFFSEVLQELRDKLQTIPDTVERLAGLDEKQWLMVRNMIDGVQEDLYQTVKKIADGDLTMNQLDADESDDKEE